MCWCCLPCFEPKPVLRINKVKFKILKLLGEGGFSYVYLVEASNGATYALKKIRCCFGAESVKIAMREVDNYKEFHSPYIIRAIDSSIVQEEDGSKTVYILLPNFDKGSLQDIINHNVIENSSIDEGEALRIFIGICRGLQAMHRHHISHPQDNEMELPQSETDNLLLGASDSEMDDDSATLPGLLADTRNGNEGIEDGVDVVDNATELTETVAFAHRDIKPANIMLSKDGLPVLCDLGSCAKARVTVKTRSAAMALQELAAEHCTLAYRAPELLDVKTGSKVDEKTDIWSLGCTLYALLYGSSPFEREENETGGSMSLAINSAKYSFPRDDGYSDSIKDLIRACIVANPEKRPAIETVLSRALELQSRI